MTLHQTFEDANNAVVSQFLEQGYVICDVEDRPALDEMRREFVAATCAHLGISHPADEGAFLDRIHEQVKVEDLNALRLGLYRGLNDRAWFRPTYFRLARGVLEQLVGNEL